MCKPSYLIPLIVTLFLSNSSLALTTLDSQKALHWLRNSAEYKALTTQIYRDAGAELSAQLHTLHTSGQLKGTNWVVSMDADETILDNSQYTLERAKLSLGYTTESWKAWVKRESATLVPGAKTFMQYVKSIGGKIAIVTNRRHALIEHTKNNLAEHGVVYDCILGKTDSSEKEARWELINTGQSECGDNVQIIMWLGDNIGDFPNITQVIRNESTEKFSDFGKKYFVLPNPTYGSWEKNSWR